MITNRSGNKTYVLLLIVFLIGFASHTDAQFYKRKINRYKNQLRDGLWITYVDSTNKTIESKGRFKKGFEKGTWKYYSADGILKKKDVFKKNKIFITYYFDDEKKESYGTAFINREEKFLTFYWTGDWKYFDREGKLRKICRFENGEELSERIIEKK